MDDAAFEVVRTLGGRASKQWQPLRVRLLRHLEDGRPLQHADLPWLGNHTLILTAEAVDAIGARLTMSGELLPLACDDADLVLFNPTSVVDCLDEQRSDLVRFTDGSIMRLKSAAFDESALRDADIFRIPQMLRGSLFLSGELVDAIVGEGLVGTDFELLLTSGRDHRS